MYSPQLTLSTTLVNNIAQIERFYGQIEALHIPKKLELNLTQKNMIKSAYASNKIEGNPLSQMEVTNLLLGDRVAVNRDEKEVINYYNILQQLPEYANKPLTLDMIVDIHSKLMTGVDKTAGEIRDIQVIVGKYNGEKGNVSLQVKHNPPYHKREQIELHLRELATWTHSAHNHTAVVRAGLFHHQFVYIHPFEDGNGRVCRILTALLFMRAGYLINRYFILDDYYDIDRQQYSDMLHAADSGDLNSWLEYFSDGVRYSMQSALSKFKEAVTTLKAEERLTPKEQEVLKIIQERGELTSNTILEILQVSRQQAHTLLKSLVDKGLVDKKGSTKSSYYFLK